MRIFFLLYIVTFYSYLSASGQVGINNTGSAPASSAMLDVKSANKGVILPRVALASLTDITTIANPDTALVIYNTVSAGSGTNRIVPGYYYWSGSRWKSMGSNYDSVAYDGTLSGVMMNVMPDYSFYPYTTASYNTKAIPDNDPAGIKDSLDVSLPDGTNMYNVIVSLRIDHTYVGDLDITLISPGGQEVLLLSSVGGAGDNFGTGGYGTYSYTNFGTFPSYSTPIISGTPPFVGNFQAQGNLLTFRGNTASGYWKLKIVDHNPVDVGSLLSWQIAVYPSYDKKWYLLREVPMTYYSGSSLFGQAYLSGVAYSEYGMNMVVSVATSSAGPIGTTNSGFTPTNSHIGVSHQRGNQPADLNRLPSYSLNLSLNHQFDPVLFTNGNLYYFQLWRQGPGAVGVSSLMIERKAN